MIRTPIAVAAAVAIALLSGCGGQSGPEAVPAQLSGKSAQLASISAAEPSVTFSGKLLDYTVARNGANFVVTEKAGSGQVVTVAAGSRLLFADATLATAPDGAPPQAYRLYQAAFDRVPDAVGLGYHISSLEGGGYSLAQIAKGFVDSPEFAAKYGALDNAQFLTQLYANVLKRKPDADGYAFWLPLLDNGRHTRASVLALFSESPENMANVAAATANGVAFIPWIVAGGGSAGSSTGATSQVFWNADAPLDLVLRDPRGTAVPSASLNCVAVNPALITVAPNCSSARGARLGNAEIVVSGAGVSALLSVKVIPQRSALGIAGSTEYFNMVNGTDGQVRAWGYNSSRQLGLGTSANGLTPSLVRNTDGSGVLSGIASVAAGESTTLAVTEDGKVYGWAGMAARPADANGLPVLIRNSANNGELQGIVEVAMGDDNAVALTDDGRVLTWGSYVGQGEIHSANFPGQPVSPSGSGALTGIVQVAAGWNYGLALAADGKVYGWGWNSSGQLGRGGMVNPERVPAAVLRASDNMPLDNIVAISAGYDMAMALTADGRVYAWGSNDYGELGQGVEDGDYSRAVLVKDPAGTGVLNNIAMVSAGGHHMLALDNTGKVYSWGLNNDKVLGLGVNSTIGRSLLPRRVVGTDSLGELSGIVSIAAGDAHSLALRSDGTVLVWGSGFGAALGQDSSSTADIAYPTPVKGIGGAGNLSLPLKGYVNLLRRGR